ncbi:MAG: hypothetical protein CO108_30140 [Deltaproteobacteria bacterium CG_4_9_14_3_um_filter_63_12]|nr:MAG: hypothetical protein CO108_30140 [Deltaproteobacteria bacterium CG_4_9_14_3_um_filter_63_12]
MAKARARPRPPHERRRQRRHPRAAPRARGRSPSPAHRRHQGGAEPDAIAQNPVRALSLLGGTSSVELGCCDEAGPRS